MPRPKLTIPENARAEALAPFVREDVVAMEAGAFERLLKHPEAFASIFDDEPEEDELPYDLRDGVAVLTVRGPLAQRGGRFWFWSWAGYDTLAADFGRALDDPEVRAVLLAIDSPGGAVAGCFDTVRSMRERLVASGKPCIAVADEHCYSAAYALAMVADELVVPQTGGVGSVGVITTMVSIARLYAQDGIDVRVIASGAEKADGHPALPIAKEAVERTQARIAALADVFTAWVAERRAIKPEAVRALEAGVRLGESAVAVGLADRIGSLDATLAALQARVATTPSPTPLTGLSPFSHSTATRQTMHPILAALGVTTDAEGITAVNALLDLRRQTHTLTGAAADDAALGTVLAWQRDATALTELRTQAIADKKVRDAADRKGLLAAAVASMRLTPAEAESDGQEGAWVTSMSNDALRAFAARPAPVIGSSAKQLAKGAPTAASLTDEQRAIADQLGVDHAAYAAELAAAG